MRPPCLVCGSNLTQAKLPGLLSCASCKFLTADLALDDAALTSLYGEDYFHGEEYGDYVSEEGELRANFRRRLRTLYRFRNPTGGALFEIGSAYGFFLEEAKADFAQVAGIDISKDAIEFARQRGLDAVPGDYLTHELPGPVDVIALWDTVEHLARPDLFLRKARQDLKTGGLVTLTTGDLGSLNARLRGKRWRMIHPPTHLHYFSQATMTRLLEREGFKVDHIEHVGVTRRVDSILFGLLVMRAGRRRAYERIRKVVPREASVTLNLRDVMYVIARAV